MLLQKHNDILKVIAIISMLIDHIGLLFFPQYEILRILGRIAFPIFAYQLAVGYRHTSSKRKYMSRLWVFALVSQIPYTLVFDTYDFNIIFTLLLAILAIDQSTKGRWWWVLLGLIIVTTSEYIDIVPAFEYGWYGVLTPLLFHWFYHSKKNTLVAQTIALLVFSTMENWWVQNFALLGTLICLYLPKSIFNVQLNKLFFYLFYPAHLLVLFIILQIILLIK